MKKVFFLICCFCFGCASQPFIIREATNPRVIVKDLRTGQEEETSDEFYEAIYPDPTRGYIENKAWPYAVRVWLIKDGKKTVLIGSDKDVPEFWGGEIREFSFSPGNYLLHIERWRKLPKIYGGWERIKKIEVVNLSVAQFERQFSANDFYGWRIIINPTSSSVY